jgi:tetratricopeptide (TPR) repeat protein
LLQRALDRHSEAIGSFAEASRLDPDDAGIAHALARVTLEAGLDAVGLFERAGRLDPASGAVLLGLVAAKLAAARGVEAEAQLDVVLERSPLWIDGHAQLAQLRAMLGKKDQAQSSIERAITAQPSEQGLWAGLFNLALGREDFAALEAGVARARGAGLPETFISPFEAIAAAELNQADRADRLFETMAPADRDSIAIWHVRHLIRTGQAQHAIALIDGELEGPRAEQFWPYASIAWRLVGDPRSDWLDAGDTLVSVFDLADRLPPLDALADVLRSLHVAKGGYLDQSVRGGTQTDGPLLSRLEPEIQALRAAIVEAVSQYRAQLPRHDAKHPLLREPRDRRVRFSGSWSVRLRDAGYHTNHVHPQGWISSALYIALPAASKGDLANAGWLKLGEAPPELGIDAPPVQRIEPKPGRLVLFPSWMWHGTIAFSQGERLTVAFDVRSPI